MDERRAPKGARYCYIIAETEDLVMIRRLITSKLEALPGKIGFYYKNLVTGETWTYHPEEKMIAASVIKLFVMAEAFRQMEQGTLDKNHLVRIEKECCVPSCGAVKYMHDGLEVTVEDLYTLMIILSDNTATNYMIDMLGIDGVNECIRELGLEKTSLGRKMFDSEKAALGIQNYICAGDVGTFLEKLCHGEVVSEEASAEMIRILKDQRLNGKIPFFLHARDNRPAIAHKTGEDDGTTHDAAIVFANQPFVLVFCSNDTDVPAYERVMQDISLMLFRMNSEENDAAGIH